MVLPRRGNVRQPHFPGLLSRSESVKFAPYALVWVRRYGAMKLRPPAAILLLLFALAFNLRVAAQDGKQQRIAELAYQAKMSHEVGACPEALDVTDRNVCLNDARDETYKNYKEFFGALREALIQSSANDANALALDGTEVVWEKYRVTACDAMGKA